MFELVYSDGGTLYKEANFLDFEDRDPYGIKYTGKVYFKDTSPEYDLIISKYEIFYEDIIPAIIGLDYNDNTIDITFKDNHLERIAEITGLPLPISKEIWDETKQNHLKRWGDNEYYVYTLKTDMEGTPFLLKLYTIAEALEWFPSHRVTCFDTNDVEVGKLELYRKFNNTTSGLHPRKHFAGIWKGEFIEANYINSNTGIILSDGRYFDITDKVVTYPNGDVHTLEQQEEYRRFHEYDSNHDLVFKYYFECQWDLETSKFGDAFFNEAREKVREVFGV